MKRFALLLIGLVVLAGIAPAASAAMIQIQLGGVDLRYNGNNVFDGGSTNPDQLLSAAFLDGETHLGTDSTDVTLDLHIPGVLHIPDTGGSVHSSAGGSLYLDLGDGEFLSLALGSATVTYQEISVGVAEIDFFFIGSAASISDQNLPYDITLGEPVTITFSTQSAEPVGKGGGEVTNFYSRGTGEIQGVPEPATLGLLSAGALAVLLRRRRK